MSQKQQELMSHMQMLEKNFEYLSQQEGAILRVIDDLSNTINSLRSLSKQSESDTLIPIGMMVHVPAKISSNQKITVNIGAGISVEKDFPSAINYLESRIKDMNIALKDVSAKKQNIGEQLNQVTQQANQLVQSMQLSDQGK